MAETNRISNPHDMPVREYKQLPWGDLIYGTKEQLQSIGIAVGMAFPGEPGGPKRSLRVADPRGFSAKVKAAYSGEGVFSVSIPFPGRDRPAFVSVFAPSVKKEEFTWGDLYTGTALSLVAAGLVRYDQLPGQPGMRKTKVTILPDGSLPTGAPTANCREAHEPGAISIYKKSKTVFEVQVIVDHAEQARRRDEHSRAEREWEARMKSLPRPEPLCCTSAKREEVRAAEELMASWHKSAYAFRESALDSADLVLGMLEAKLLDGVNGGWRFNDDTARKIEHSIDQLIRLVRTGAIVMDQALRDKYTPACVFDSVKAAEERVSTLAQYGGNVVPFNRRGHQRPR